MRTLTAQIKMCVCVCNACVCVRVRVCQGVCVYMSVHYHVV